MASAPASTAPLPIGMEPFPGDPAEKLPSEVRQFLEGPGHRIILLRGPPGSGKTALAARLLEVSQTSRVWLNTRVRTERWARKPEAHAPRAMAPMRVFDLSLGPPSADAGGKGFAEARDALLRHPGTPRGDSALTWLPMGFREAFAAGDGEAEPLAVVVASWEGLVDHYLDAPWGPDSPNARPGQVERFLLAELAHRTDRLILLTEHEEQTPLDFLVDSVLVTASGDFDDRLVRVLMIPKLAGAPVDETVYPFTLDGGFFTYIHRLPSLARGGTFGYEPDPHPEVEGLWPGSAGFARAFGRLPLGTVSLLERDAAVPAELVRLITFAILTSTVAAGGRAVAALSSDLTPESLFAGLQRRLPDPSGLERIRFLTAAPTDHLPEPVQRVMVPLYRQTYDAEVSFVPVQADHESERTQALFPETTRFLRSARSGNAPAAMILNLEGLQAAAHATGRSYTPQSLPAILQHDVQGEAVHAVVTGRSDDPLVEPLRTFANPYLRLLERRGRIFLYGVRPWTSAYVLQPRFRPEEPHPFDLIRMS